MIQVLVKKVRVESCKNAFFLSTLHKHWNNLSDLIISKEECGRATCCSAIEPHLF
jgi:hypothetical protein